MRASPRALGLALFSSAAVAASAYALLAARTYVRFGHPAPPRPDEAEPLLDYFMPAYDVVTRHARRIDAPAEAVLEAARTLDLWRSPIARAIFRARELVLGATPGPPRQPRGLVDEVKALGWGVLEDLPGRALVMGAVTKPWEADVVFRALRPGEFAAFAEPGWVKIAWTLRADALDARSSRFRTETRALATDAASRARFRRYWARFSPGMWLIRWTLLGPLERTARQTASTALTAS